MVNEHHLRLSFNCMHHLYYNITDFTIQYYSYQLFLNNACEHPIIV